MTGESGAYGASANESSAEIPTRQTPVADGPTEESLMEGCGYSYDHTTVEDTVDGMTVWTCRECGAEGFEEAEDA